MPTAFSGLPDVFARPELIEPGKDSVDGPVASIAIRERSAAELLATQLQKDPLNHTCPKSVFGQHLRQPPTRYLSVALPEIKHLSCQADMRLPDPPPSFSE